MFSANLPANPLQYPKRVVSLYTVDLRPLFKWWSKRDGPRPLGSWVHVTGSIVGTNSLGWVLEGQVERGARDLDRGKAATVSERGSRRIILSTPPVEDLVQFGELSSKLNELSIQRSDLLAQQRQLSSRRQAVAQQENVLRHSGARAQVLAMENRRLKQAESDAKARQKPLDQQIQDLKSRLSVYPASDHFAIDCFALDLQREFEKLPVYDHGRVLR